MNRKSIFFVAGLVILSLTGCNLPRATSTPFPTPILLSSPTPYAATLTVAEPTATSTVSLPTITPTAATATTGGAVPGSSSGTYAVILVAPSDVLTIRSAAGAGNAAVGSFAATATDVMRTGPTSTVGGALWVQVQNPSGGNGWVNAAFLTEYVPSASFCADTQVNTLLTNFGNALDSSNGGDLAKLVSPAHGMAVRLWRNGNVITFDINRVPWVFGSTYVHHWGAAPGSGLETDGAFHVVVLPKLLDVFDANYTLTCNSLGSAAQYGSDPWPLEYANVNYYTVYKPGTPGDDLDWRYWLVGVEYVQGQPYVFGLIHFQWEP